MTDPVLGLIRSVKVSDQEELVYQTWKVWPISGWSLLREAEVSVNYLSHSREAGKKTQRNPKKSQRGASKTKTGWSEPSIARNKTICIFANF